MADAGGVAARLWDEWIPAGVRRLVADELPSGDEDSRSLVVWLATCHDIGKATPAFACQVEALAQRMRDAGLEMPTRKQFGDDRRRAPHGLAGQFLLQEWLVERWGWPERSAVPFAIAVGGHHGVPPGRAQLPDLKAHQELLRTPGVSEKNWRSVQGELLDTAAAVCGMGGRLGAWREVKLSQPAQVLLTAVVIVSDWIASNADLFPYDRFGGAGGGSTRVDSGWAGLGLPAPWAAVAPKGAAEEVFAGRFGWADSGRVRPVQREALRAARELGGPGLLIVEAPMGEGKTEAALVAAEVLAAASGAGGCFVALPTRATGNAMFSRVLDWLERLPDSGGGSVFLAHAKAGLNEEYVDLLRAGSRRLAAIEVDGADDDWRPARDVCSGSAELAAHQWLRGRKTGMLASFAVGTVDQLLFAGLKSRHLALRHLALAGKVVVIDEVHAYDAYMNVYLERVLSWLGAYRVPVVMLSATLPAGRRRALAEAYAGAGAGPMADEERYPLITVVSANAPARSVPVAAAGGRAVGVRMARLDDDFEVLAKLLGDELDGGGCALVVRNTVDRVLRTAAVLRERFGDDRVTVAHSRFVDLDRARVDGELVRRFGPAGDRPVGGHVVVASQVAEQSLDVDFDVLVSDLAPVDLVLQRLGRLHRHHRGGRGQSDRPPKLREPRCWVTGVAWTTGVPEPVPGSCAVYGRHALLRSLAVLEPYLDGTALELPRDISALVQAAYGEGPVGPVAWRSAMAQAAEEEAAGRAERERRADEFLLDEVRRPGRSLIGWLDAGVGDADDTRAGRAQVRDSPESLEVLVIQRRADGSLATLPWLQGGRGGLELPVEAAPDGAASRAVAGCALRLPWQFTRPGLLDQVIAELEQSGIPAWQGKESPLLAGELVLILDEDCRSRLAAFDLRYSRTDGLMVTRAGAGETTA